MSGAFTKNLADPAADFTVTFSALLNQDNPIPSCTFSPPYTTCTPIVGVLADGSPCLHHLSMVVAIAVPNGKAVIVTAGIVTDSSYGSGFSAGDFVAAFADLTNEVWGGDFV